MSVKKIELLSTFLFSLSFFFFFFSNTFSFDSIISEPQGLSSNHKYEELVLLQPGVTDATSSVSPSNMQKPVTYSIEVLVNVCIKTSSWQAVSREMKSAPTCAWCRPICPHWRGQWQTGQGKRLLGEASPRGEGQTSEMCHTPEGGGEYEVNTHGYLRENSWNRCIKCLTHKCCGLQDKSGEHLLGILSSN